MLPFQDYLPLSLLIQTPPPDGYPPQKPGPGEPGFIPPPGCTPKIQDRVAVLREALTIKGNEKQGKNIEAVIRSLEKNEETSEYYQDGRPITLDQYDKTKGPIWLETMDCCSFTRMADALPTGVNKIKYCKFARFVESYFDDSDFVFKVNMEIRLHPFVWLARETNYTLNFSFLARSTSSSP
ncbi:hypothetical protein TWF481_003297 [Arthrobotrys musiformis]|uniref:Uncharacterized protein n=1 Tax=Arthrobotrys musiformis TaxID=47236 RepID=A0AAV9VS14_9PEZI